MSLDIGSQFANAYRADDGQSYAMTVDLLSYNTTIPAFPADGLPPLPWRLTPRHWVAQYTGIEGIFLVRVICPVPFSELSQPDARTIVTSNQYALSLLERVGEIWSIFECP